MLTGISYDSFVPELKKARFKARAWAHQYNTYWPTEGADADPDADQQLQLVEHPEGHHADVDGQHAPQDHANAHADMNKLDTNSSAHILGIPFLPSFKLANLRLLQTPEARRQEELLHQGWETRVICENSCSSQVRVSNLM